MPRYFFDIHDGIEVYDSRGTEFLAIENARAHAMQMAAAYAARPIGDGQDGGAIVVDVRDESGPAFTVRLVFTLQAA